MNKSEQTLLLTVTTDGCRRWRHRVRNRL